METRQLNIEVWAGDGNLEALQKILQDEYTQLELDSALENALAYSQIEVADYLLSLGANIAYHDYAGVYWAIHNNELEGLKYAIAKGVDINTNNGLFLNKSVHTAIYNHDSQILVWLLQNGADKSFLAESSLQMLKKIKNFQNKYM